MLLGQPLSSCWYWCVDQTMVQRVLSAKGLEFLGWDLTYCLHRRLDRHWYCIWSGWIWQCTSTASNQYIYLYLLYIYIYIYTHIHVNFSDIHRSQLLFVIASRFVVKRSAPCAKRLPARRRISVVVNLHHLNLPLRLVQATWRSCLPFWWCHLSWLAFLKDVVYGCGVWHKNI